MFSSFVVFRKLNQKNTNPFYPRHPRAIILSPLRGFGGIYKNGVFTTLALTKLLRISINTSVPTGENSVFT